MHVILPLKTKMSPENQWLEDVFPTEIVPTEIWPTFCGIHVGKNTIDPLSGFLVIKSPTWEQMNFLSQWPQTIPFLRGVVIPLIFPKVPQSSQTESLGFPSYPLPLNTPLKNPTIKLLPTSQEPMDQL